MIALISKNNTQLVYCEWYFMNSNLLLDLHPESDQLTFVQLMWTQMYIHSSMVSSCVWQQVFTYCIGGSRMRCYYFKLDFFGKDSL